MVFQRCKKPCLQLVNNYLSFDMEQYINITSCQWLSCWLDWGWAFCLQVNSEEAEQEYFISWMYIICLIRDMIWFSSWMFQQKKLDFSPKDWQKINSHIKRMSKKCKQYSPMLSIIRYITKPPIVQLLLKHCHCNVVHSNTVRVRNSWREKFVFVTV